MDLINLLLSYKKRKNLIKKILLNEYKISISEYDKYMVNILFSKLNVEKID